MMLLLFPCIVADRVGYASCYGEKGVDDVEHRSDSRANLLNRAHKLISL